MKISCVSLRLVSAQGLGIAETAKLVSAMLGEVGLQARLLPAGARGQGYAGLLGADPLERYFRMVTFQRTETLPGLLAADARAQMQEGVDVRRFHRLLEEGHPPDHVAALQYLDVRTYLPDDILTKVDRTSMLVSLETRVPLLDHRLMEYVATMPTALKLYAGAGKLILKRAMAGDLPATVLHRSKMGFGVPLETWFRSELTGYARELLLGPRARQRGFFAPGAVARLLEEHRTRGRDRSGEIWTLVCFEEWARQWFGG